MGKLLIQQTPILLKIEQGLFLHLLLKISSKILFKQYVFSKISRIPLHL